MPLIGLIKEGKVPADNRVALTPDQCKWLIKHIPGLHIIAEPAPNRCFSDDEYAAAGVTVSGDISACDLLLGIKEVPATQLLTGKKYLFFSHTRKKQEANRALMQAMVRKNITLIDYECLEHDDGQRIIGFGFFAGIVGAHNGIMAYGKRTGLFNLDFVFRHHDYRELIHTYFGLKLPNIKIAVTGSGRVANGIVEIMNLMDVQEVEPGEYLQRNFNYPVYVHLKGQDLYIHRQTGTYQRDDFHANPAAYDCLFKQYCTHTDILMNGIYWDTSMPRLFEWEDMRAPDFRIKTIADITDDKGGSIPCNLGDAIIGDPVYGVNVQQRMKAAPYGDDVIDVMAVGNLPNELPRDASRYFGEQLMKYILPDLLQGSSAVIDRATILSGGKLTPQFEYLADYAAV
ncbi:NAD(P)-dependent oxidoreductase [Deminuibacter soli]|uniref:Alanine dehydrogenase n=1 Tax=Deminuibacter soli TaxID=2291815 RepID=A0A3E1NMH8_9BACT|nr:NAD(P)-dependent oxidoreductase [Deminuibacter soli]RFM29136.1 alanine dehydrogenase [Deminuibacter soli]